MFLLSRKYTGALFGAILTGVLAGVAFPTVSPVSQLSLLFPLALVPLLAVLEQLPVQAGGAPRAHLRLARSSFFRRFVAAFLICWLAGVVFELIAMHWLPTPVMRVGNVGQALSVVLSVLYALGAALYFPILLLPFVANAARGAKRLSHPFPIWAMAVFSMAIEMTMPQLWPWRLGAVVSSALPGLAQWMSLFGGAVLTPFVVGTAAWMARALVGLSGSVAHFAVTTVSALVLWGGLWGLGTWRESVLSSKFSQLEQNSIGIIQPDVDQANKFRVAEAVRNRPGKVERLVGITQEMFSTLGTKGKKVDLVVWPEGALPSDFLSSAAMQEEVRTLSRQMGVPILVQALEFDSGDFARTSGRNSGALKTSFLFRPDGSRSDSTHQWNPAPFLESVPFEDSLPFLGSVARTRAPFLFPWKGGQSASALPYSPDIKVGVLISFDVTSSEFARRLVGKQEAGLLVHQADFTPLTGTGATLFMQEFARWRAVEVGRSVVSVSNTGPSAAFSPTGEKLPLEMADNGTWAVAVVPVFDAENFTETFYSELGTFPLGLLGLAGFIYLVFAFWRRGR